ncbi:TPA: adenylosuccinate synthetase [Candidatus Geothermarchaeota archaeon]|nr:adenylosuccinate synthetase [Candidatus Geothermarchaeota archaeon]HIQ13430.1 adenylosuccinate synthetase [Thermoprotei archaeon]
MLSVVVDGFFGDTGKGKVVSYLSLKDDADIIVRAGVGPNAGHTVVFRGKEYKLRQIPSGFVNKRSRLMIGAGVLIYPPRLLEEITITDVKDRIYVDYQAGIIEDRHILEERESEYLSKKIGSTKTGCGAAMKDRVLRKLKLARDVPELKNFLKDVSLEINIALDGNKKVIIEGTQGTYLSLYHGTYPYVTSKDVTASAFCSDVGVGPKRVDDVILVFKSYVTRVGGGPLENEFTEKEARTRGLIEIATVTGRIRRVAPFNFNYAKRAVMLNSPTQIALTKLDILFKEDYGKTEFDDLSINAKNFIEKIENELKVPVSLISTGPDTEFMIDRRQELGLL